jgi:hypothetical protein
VASDPLIEHQELGLTRIRLWHDQVFHEDLLGSKICWLMIPVIEEH